MAPHKHRAVPSLSRTIGWTHCVAVGPCSGAAHGGVTHIDTCRCGAKRKIECNGRHTARGSWTKEEN